MSTPFHKGYVPDYIASSAMRPEADGSGNITYLGNVANAFVRFGKTGSALAVKIHNRPATLGYSLEVRARPETATATHFAIDSTLDWRADASSGGVRAVQGVSRLDTGKTATGGSLTGVYGQFANNGTLNGSGIMVNAMYGLIENGGVYTSISHLAALWLDSHLAKTVSAGDTSFLYISNNGGGSATTFGQAIYVYAGNKITNLFTINTASGMVSANNGGGSTLNFTNWKTIKVDLDGTTHYLVAAQTIA